MPCSVRFETVYEPGEVTAVSYSSGKEISRDTLVTTGNASRIRLVPEKDNMNADGHDLIYVAVEMRAILPDSDLQTPLRKKIIPMMKQQLSADVPCS